MTECLVCRTARASRGGLCAACQHRIPTRVTITPEQVQTYGTAGDTGAGLIDQWGRLHRLGPHSTIGRYIDAPGLAVLHASISRQHASLSIEPRSWIVRDLESANGTYRNDRRVEGAMTIRHGHILRFAEIGMFFVVGVDHASVPRVKRAISETPEIAMSARPTLRFERVSSAATTSFMLHQPTGGGGGMVEIDGKQVQLTTPQFELLTLLIDRAVVQGSDESRGFVPTAQLINLLSLDAVEPGADSIRQLVRRLRAALSKAGVPDIIESSPGSGYRLRVTPRVERG